MTTKIQWTDEVWNPIVGCSRISPGCANCYASVAAASPRLQKFPQYQEVGDWDGTVDLVKSQLPKPLRWKKSRKIFVCSMSDLFHENIPDAWRDKVFAIIAAARWHTFQILTKRPQKALEYFQRPNLAQRIKDAGDLVCKPELPLKNVWFGVTVENQQMLDQRLELLLQIKASVRWLSVEPLLEEIDLALLGTVPKTICPTYTSVNEFISWVVVGGESGYRSRVCQMEWISSVVHQCQVAGVRVFVKQLGSNSPHKAGTKGGDITKFPPELQIREFPDET